MADPPSHLNTGGGDSGAGPDRDSTGMPRWVWLVGISAVLVVLLIVILVLTGVFGGGHTPGPPPGGH